MTTINVTWDETNKTLVNDLREQVTVNGRVIQFPSCEAAVEMLAQEALTELRHMGESDPVIYTGMCQRCKAFRISASPVKALCPDGCCAAMIMEQRRLM